MFNKLRKVNKGSGESKFFKKNWLIILAVAYFLLPVDLIPDVLPMFGITDDILVLLVTGLVKYLKSKKGKKKEKIIEGELVDE